MREIEMSFKFLNFCFNIHFLNPLYSLAEARPGYCWTKVHDLMSEIQFKSMLTDSLSSGEAEM